MPHTRLSLCSQAFEKSGLCAQHNGMHREETGECVSWITYRREKNRKIPWKKAQKENEENNRHRKFDLRNGTGAFFISLFKKIDKGINQSMWGRCFERAYVK